MFSYEICCSPKLSLEAINCEIIVTCDQGFGGTLIKVIWTSKLLYIIVGPMLLSEKIFAAQKVYSNKLLHRRRVSNVRLV